MSREKLNSNDKIYFNIGYLSCINLQIKDHNFTLSSNRTIFWENKSALLLSDIHAGGRTAIQTDILISNFKKALQEFEFNKLIILGDLFDAAASIKEKQIFSDFLKTLDTNIVLVLGNHDKLSEEEYREFGIKTIKESLKMDMFYLTHKPTESEKINIHGHIHPGYYKRSLLIMNKLPCFVIEDNSICLPAFGGATGKNSFIPLAQRKIYVIRNNLVKLL